jgi:hypothetical protein
LRTKKKGALQSICLGVFEGFNLSTGIIMHARPKKNVPMPNFFAVEEEKRKDTALYLFYALNVIMQ